jgi:hypothetical protein
VQSPVNSPVLPPQCHRLKTPHVLRGAPPYTCSIQIVCFEHAGTLKTTMTCSSTKQNTNVDIAITLSTKTAMQNTLENSFDQQSTKP